MAVGRVDRTDRDLPAIGTPSPSRSSRNATPPGGRSGDGDARIVTFGNGAVAREVIVALDDGQRRLVWSIVGGRFIHHNGAVQVLEEPSGGSRVVWIADLLPHSMAGEIAPMMEHGLAVMKRTLEAAAAR